VLVLSLIAFCLLSPAQMRMLLGFGTRGGQFLLNAEVKQFFSLCRNEECLRTQNCEQASAGRVPLVMLRTHTQDESSSLETSVPV
jgi:hypothetical protein